MNWKLTQISKHSYECRVKLEGNQDTGSALLMSDEHWDNKHCDRRLLWAHHMEAQKRGSPIFKFGDTLCLMQGKWDRRKSDSELRPEHRGADYLNKVKKTAIRWYEPFKGNIALITKGNHEESILYHHDYDILDELTEGLGVPYGPYHGFIKFRISLPSKSNAASFDLCWHHGYGGGGEVTRGFIDNNRTRGQYLADVYYSGHIHRRNLDENIITRLSDRSVVSEMRQWFIRGSCYKREESYYHIAGGRAARPLGGWWLNVSVSKPKDTYVCNILPIPAM